MYKIYKLKNKLNEKVYIGMSNNVERRWRNNGIEYKPKKDKDSRIWDAIVEFGFDAFDKSIIEEVETLEQAIEREMYYIYKYQSTKIQFGYNISHGGNGGLIYEIHPKGMLGKPQTEYQKENHRIWASNHENNCMTNGKVIWGKTHEHPKGMLGKTHSEEYIARLKEIKGSKHHQAKAIISEINGITKEYGHVSEIEADLGISRDTVYRIIKSEEPYNTRFKNKKHLIGLKLKYK